MGAQEDFVRACADLLPAKHALRDSVARKEAGLRGMVVEDRIAKNALGRVARRLLEDAGFTADQIHELGVSDGNVRLALEPLKGHNGNGGHDPHEPSQ